MASPSKRSLPKRRNPLLEKNLQEHSELVALRRLGQTALTGPGGEPSGEGSFDYAHLRLPLPKGIVSGVFNSSPSGYFLMRRSQDGYVSGTGMFKATFPYASAAEEESERQYLKSLQNTSREETAGNVWIPPEQALTLAEEYEITPWVRALLDPAKVKPVEQKGSPKGPPKKIANPPKFDLTKVQMPVLAPPTPTSLPRSRGRRSASPSKKSSKKALSSPRKRTSKANTESADSTPSHSIKGASVEAPEKPPSTLESVDEDEVVTVQIDQEVKKTEDGVEVKHTAVSVNLPYSAVVDGPSEADAKKMISEAKKLVEAATELEAASSAPKKGKRKAAEISVADDEDKVSEAVPDADAEAPSAKKAKTDVEMRKSLVVRRAMVGIGATAIAAGIPWLMGYI